MTRFLVLLLCLTAACKSQTEQEKFRQNIEGDWIVLLADHKLTNEDQRQVYGRIQDSVVAAKSLKLVTFGKDGIFQQLDEPHKKGKWALSPSMQLYIADGGTGFNEFKADFQTYEEKTLQVVEYIFAKNENIKLVWYLKKINQPNLFDREKNNWREKATRIESDAEIKQRLSAIFTYYSDYFKLVSKESTFFISSRVILPLRFYQHAVGSTAFKAESEFANLFFNQEQAELAYGYVKKTVYDLGNKYPSAKNYVDEYALFLELVGDELREK